MAIAHIADSALGNFTSSLSQSVTITPAVGDFILVTCGHQDFGLTGPSLAISDSVNSYVQLFFKQSTNNEIQVAAWLALSSGSSALTITITASSGTAGNSFGGMMASRFSGIMSPISSALDQVTTSTGNTSTPATGSTAGLAASNDLAVCVFSMGNSMAGLTNPPVGGSGSFTDMINSPTSDFTVSAWQILTSNSAVGANIGTVSGGNQWSAGIITLLAAPSASSGNQRLMTLGIG